MKSSRNISALSLRPALQELLVLTHAKLVSFVATADPEASRQFYEGVLGLPLVADEPSALVFDANGTMLRVSKVKDFSPAPYTVLGWEVDAVQAYAKMLAQKGVEPEWFEGLPQNDQGVCAFPDGSLVLWFRDPDRNLLSLTQLPTPAETSEEPPPTVA